MESGGGDWDGKCYRLREFNCPNSSGNVKGVHFQQTLARITLRYSLPGEVAGLAAEELTVELSSWELTVRVEGRKELDPHFAAITGDLHADVRRELSWWTLEKDASGSVVFLIELAKKEHKGWNTIWKVGLNHHRKTHFSWAPNAKNGTAVQKAEDMLVRVKPGRRALRGKDAFIISRENLCRSFEDGQDESTVAFRIHFFKEVLEKACETVCLGDLFGVDVMEKYVKVFIRGDEKSPIIMGELFGTCIPQKTTWSIIKAKPPPDDEEEDGGQRPPQKQQQRGLAQYANCLQITLVKSAGSSKPWPQILSENEHALLRDAAPLELEALQAKAVRPPSPDRTNWSPEEHSRENKAKGDACFKRSEWRDAGVYYTRAINHTPDDERLYSNRSACYIRLRKYDRALKDANKVVSLKPGWPKAYFRQGQALRGLERWDEAILAFKEGRFRDARNPDWDNEIEKTEDERQRFDEKWREQCRLKREADMTTELNEATVVAEREAMAAVAEQALRAGKSRKEAGELAAKGAELAKQRVHEMAAKRKAAMVEDDKELDNPPPYRIVREDGTTHARGFCHTEKGNYFMGMTLMNFERAPKDQPWVEIRHPGKVRWSQGCAQLRLKVSLPESVKGAAELDVQVTPHSLRIGTVGDSDAIVVGDFDRRVDPEGENFSWYLIPEERTLEMSLDKDASEVYQTFSYSTLLWPRLFKDDIALGDGLFEADLTDLPPELLERFKREQARANQTSLEERARRKMMTEEEISEETARNWNDEFARHGMPHRLDTNEDRMLESTKF